MNNDQDNQQPNMNSVPPQPSFTPPPAQHPQQPVQQHQGAAQYQHVENPGQTLGSIGLVLNFFMINLGGIILGIISRNKSKKANMPTTIGTISLVWGIVGFIIGLIVTAFMILAFIGTYSGIQDTIDRHQQETLEWERRRESDTYNNLDNSANPDRLNPSELESYQYDFEESI